MSHFRFFRRGYGSDFSGDDRLRQFVRKYRKTILILLVVVVILILFFAVLAGLLLFKVIIPVLLGSADSPTAQSGFAVLKSWLTQLINTSPLQWLGLFLQAGA